MPVDPARLAACFDEAVELGPPAQQALLASLDDPELRAELTRLLAHDRAHPPAKPAPEDMSEGTRIGELVILGKIGRGATSTVYAARDEALGRTVAIKRPHGRFAGIWGSANHQRVRSEARALAHLAHPNVVALHELREHHGEFLLIMEHVHGAPLGAWILQTPRPWRPLLATLLQAGRGLAAAHALGLSHGDFKPDNVLVGADQRVRVVDFGLAHLLAEPGSPSTLAGTPAYMAPEQFAGHPGDARSDQFAFCVTAYTCLFGQPPFPADTLPALVERLTEPPAPIPANDLPPALVAAVLRGLARDPAERWPDMNALLAALEREHGRDPEDDLRVGRRQRHLATLGLLLSAIAIDAWIFLRPDAAPAQLTPRDLVHFMLVVMALLLALVAGFWRAFRQNRANRRLIGVVLLALGSVLVHRLVALQHDTPPSHTLAVDLLLLAACAGITALTFRRQFLAPAVVFLIAAALAALAPERAPAVFSASSVTTFALVLLWWPRDGEL